MSRYSFTSSRPPHCVCPRPISDPSLRRHTYGPVQPMQDTRPSLWRRLFGRR